MLVYSMWYSQCFGRWSKGRSDTAFKTEQIILRDHWTSLTCQQSYSRNFNLSPFAVVQRFQISMSFVTDFFGIKRENIDSCKIQPCKDCLYKQSRRTNYKAAVRKRTLERFPQIPCAVVSGWCYENGLVSINWMSGKFLQTAILKLLSCWQYLPCKLLPAIVWRTS